MRRKDGSTPATMGQLRTATRTLADLGLDPAQVLRHLDHITAELEATCDRLLAAPRHGDAADDVALVIAHVRPHPPVEEASAPT
ncbi:hypothetical protein ACGFX2_08365 [Streptomyces goshikiensis]|uniref:hypothetical protein n=1 Tax=Streptomyces goshikiensis TaxID=1942 RepID=UPI00371D0011